MKQILAIIISSVFITSSCSTNIKNKEAKIEIEKGTEIDSSKIKGKVTTNPVVSHQVPKKLQHQLKPLLNANSEDSIIGFWVGYFEKDDDSNGYLSENDLYVDDGYYWRRENKINISIDNIQDTIVTGHSVVAGNDRPFNGTVKEDSIGTLFFKVKEPGNDKYDGEFTFKIEDSVLVGTWKAYRKINIQKRKYDLRRKNYTYNPNINLERAKVYIDWNKKIGTSNEPDPDDEFGGWVSNEFSSATNKIYEINASNTVLNKADVENLKKGDLLIIRNTIYARHGYSFKKRPLRVFFDAQSWYIPVHTDIRHEFTEIEKNNIQLLLKYEKNAEEYYDYFGRG
ncbi:YARHG domain-containing protein [Limibacter armeniacum]|uniref:YARHG domain-containing protein n=1 Tax=Limibacter armeniacum TaxID=466084 RepID=UPI002FE53BD3